MFTVIVTVDASQDLIPALQEHAAMGIRRFDTYPGYLGGALHVSADGTRLVQYLQWESESSYESCRTDPAWDALRSTQHFLAAVASGRATIDSRSFHVAELHEGS